MSYNEQAEVCASECVWERTWAVRHDGHACNPCTQEAGTGEVGV